MTRLLPTRAAAILSALLCLECTGQSIEGLWIGRYPGSDSDACQIRIKDDFRFSVACKKSLMAVGRYRWDGKTLELQTQMMSLNGVEVPARPVYKVDILGHGNHLEAAVLGLTYQWQRRPM